MPETRHPKDDLVRAIRPGFELRATDDGEPETLVGHFARFNDWTQIESTWEGHFMERIAPGAFAKTMADNRSNMRVLFNHGMDPQLGDQVIASITELREDRQGAYYEAPLIDGIPPLILNGLRQKPPVYGASFRFKVMREEWVDNPDESPTNPNRLPERTVKEAQVFEFGPVTFPAYVGATAGVRSMTDEYIVDRLAHNPERLRELLTTVSGEFGWQGPAPSDDAGHEPTSPERRGDPPPEQGDPQEQDPAPKPGLLIPTPRLIRSDADWDAFLERANEWTN